MLLLAIETTTARGGLALLRDGLPPVRAPFPEGLVHGREVVPRLAALLREEGFEPADVEGIAVARGPGSYTGARVGVTAAKTLALALRIPVAGVSSLEVLARSAWAAEAREPVDAASPSRLVVLLDARRGRAYAAAFGPPGGDGAPRRHGPDAVLPRGERRALLEPGAALVGDAADAEFDALRAAGDPLAATLRRWPAERDTPDPVAVGEAARPVLDGAVFEAEAVHRLEPLYLLPSAAERRAGPVRPKPPRG